MGRTLPTYTDLVLSLPEHLKKFRRALRKEDQAVLDQILADMLKHTGEGSYSGALNPVEVMLVSVLIEQQKRINILEETCLEK